MLGFRGGVLWGTLRQGVFGVASPSNVAVQRIYSSDYDVLGSVEGRENGVLLYDFVAIDARTLAYNKVNNLADGVVCVAGRFPASMGKDASDELEGIIPNDDGKFDVLFWKARDPLHPLMQRIVDGDLDEDRLDSLRKLSGKAIEHIGEYKEAVKKVAAKARDS